MMLKYFAPSAMTVGVVGQQRQHLVREEQYRMPNISTASEPPKRKATPMMCGIGSSLFLPQYCEPITTAPSPAPTTSICSRNCIWLHRQQTYAAHRVLTVPSEHERVHHVDAVGQQILQRQRQRQHHKGFIKRLFPLSLQQPLAPKPSGEKRTSFCRIFSFVPVQLFSDVSLTAYRIFF